MKLTVELPDYDGEALDVVWEKEALYKVSIHERDVTISANKNGLISLAMQMLYMAHNDLPDGSHVHYEDFFCEFTTSDYGLIIEKYELL